MANSLTNPFGGKILSRLMQNQLVHLPLFIFDKGNLGIDFLDEKIGFGFSKPYKDMMVVCEQLLSI